MTLSERDIGRRGGGAFYGIILAMHLSSIEELLDRNRRCKLYCPPSYTFLLAPYRKRDHQRALQLITAFIIPSPIIQLICNLLLVSPPDRWMLPNARLPATSVQCVSVFSVSGSRLSYLGSAADREGQSIVPVSFIHFLRILSGDRVSIFRRFPVLIGRGWLCWAGCW